MSADKFLNIHNLSYAYGKQQVLDRLSVDLYPAQLTALLGLNGQGKSTLLRLIAGVLPSPLPAVNFTSNKPSIGYMPERPLSFPELSVIDNLRFAAQINRMNEADMAAALQQTLSDCHLQDKANKPAGSLSKGYQQRLGLAMAIVHGPQLILLDEPTDGMDPAQLQSTWQLIGRLAQNSCVVLSSHRISEVAEHCQRVLVMHQGQIRDQLMMDDAAARQSLAGRFHQITAGDVV